MHKPLWLLTTNRQFQDLLGDELQMMMTRLSQVSTVHPLVLPPRTTTQWCRLSMQIQMPLRSVRCWKKTRSLMHCVSTVSWHLACRTGSHSRMMHPLTKRTKTALCPTRCLMRVTVRMCVSQRFHHSLVLHLARPDDTKHIWMVVPKLRRQMIGQRCGGARNLPIEIHAGYGCHVLTERSPQCLQAVGSCAFRQRTKRDVHQFLAAMHWNY